MQLQTFKAPTMAEALAQVKSVMGSDAIILHTRTYQVRGWMGLRRREMVEITAGKGMNIGTRARKPAAGHAGAAAAAKAYGAPGGNGALTKDPPSKDAAPRSPEEGRRQLLETPAAASAAMLTLSQEMSALRGMVQDLVVAARKEKAPDVPADLFDFYLTLIQNQVANDLAAEIVQTLHKQLRPEQLAQLDVVRERLAEQIEKLVPTAGPIARTKTEGAHVVALIGPTGVGKTTTIAKLAAHLKLRERQRVGLITLDTYRIAAVDQLRRYAEIIGAPLKVVSGIGELKDAMAALADCHYILIDTAGRSPNDTLKLNELRTLLEVAEPDEVHLVLSSTASESCVELAIAKFGEVRADKIIFTKIDEAAHLGVVLNVARKLKKGLSYLTTGQDVPDDIEVGRGKRLAQLILGMQVGGG